MPFFRLEEHLIIYEICRPSVEGMANRLLRSRGGKYDLGHGVWLKADKQVSGNR